ncbi:MAG: hypothetical protein IJN20_07525 [Oscillospiraceae bacterium]|nr:hypothetical protein [Oscillospiraceae bacterium]
MVISARYDQQFNRTIPHQIEGPEFTPYENTGSTATKPAAKRSALLAALMAAAALAALILPLCFSIKNVQPRSAELHFAVVAEEGYKETDMITYQLLFGGDPVEEGLLPFGKSVFLLDDLEPDSRYTVEIFKNGEPEKTLNFRTKPEDGAETTAPGTEPPADTQPAPADTQPEAPETQAQETKPVTEPTEISVPTEPTKATAPTEATTPKAPVPPPYTPPIVTPEPEETIPAVEHPIFNLDGTPSADFSWYNITFNTEPKNAIDLVYTVVHTAGGATVGTYTYDPSVSSVQIPIPAEHRNTVNRFDITLSYKWNGISAEQTLMLTEVPPSLLPGISGDPTFTLLNSGTQLGVSGRVDPNGVDPNTITLSVETENTLASLSYNSTTNEFYTNTPIDLSETEQNAPSIDIRIYIFCEIGGLSRSTYSDYTFMKPVTP